MIPSALWRHELARTPRAVVLGGMLGGVALVVATHVVLPRLPALALDLLATAFRIDGPRALLALNDHLTTWIVVFFTGVALQHAALVAPRADRELALWLAQPLPTSHLLRLRALPTLLLAALTGVTTSIATAVSVALAPAGGTTTALGALLGGLVTTTLAVGLLATLLVLAATEDDSFRLLVVSFVAWTVPLLPASVLVYRPDLLDPDGALAGLLVLPVNVVWADVALLPTLGALLLLTAAWTWGVLHLAGRRFAHAEL